MKKKHEIKLDRTEVSMCRWVFSFKLNEKKTNTENRELLASGYVLTPKMSHTFI